MKNKLIIVLLVTILSGCATQTYLVNGDTVNEPDIEKSEHFFIGGIGQKKTINAAAVCGSSENVIKVETEQTFVNGLLGAVTWGIYSPRTARVYCKA